MAEKRTKTLVKRIETKEKQLKLLQEACFGEDASHPESPKICFRFKPSSMAYALAFDSIEHDLERIKSEYRDLIGEDYR